MKQPGFNPNIQILPSTEDAQKKREKIEELLEQLHELKNDYWDNMPEEEIVTYVTPNYDKYKCRDAFFSAVSLEVEYLINKGYIKTDNTIKDCKEFLKYCATRHKTDGKKPRFKRENIDLANQTIDACITELSKSNETN